MERLGAVFCRWILRLKELIIAVASPSPPPPPLPSESVQSEGLQEILLFYVQFVCLIKRISGCLLLKFNNGHDSGRGILQNAEFCLNDSEGTVGDQGYETE